MPLGCSKGSASVSVRHLGESAGLRTCSLARMMGSNGGVKAGRSRVMSFFGQEEVT